MPINIKISHDGINYVDMTCMTNDDWDKLKTTEQLKEEIDIAVDKEDYERAGKLKKILDSRK